MDFQNFKNLFSISKTLRFELKPIGKTQENFEKYIFSNDKLKAEKFKIVKKYCDEYHKKFIEDCLSDFNDEKFNMLIEQYYSLFILPDKDEKAFEDIKNSLRKIISEKFTKNENYKKLLGKELVSEFLKECYKNDSEKLEEINLFEGFTTYFTGYNTNRENMYSSEDKHTCIAYRLIDENLPVFIKNMQIYKKIEEKIPNLKENITKNFNINPEIIFTSAGYFSKCITQKQIEEYNNIICGCSKEDGTKIQGINEFVNLYKQQSKEKLPFLKPLYKQILSDKDSISFIIDKINDDKELAEIINCFYEEIKTIIVRDEFKNIFNDIAVYDLDKIYIDKDLSLTSLSKSAFGNWDYVNLLMDEEYTKNYKGRDVFGSEKYLKKKEDYFKSVKTVTVKKISDLIQNYADDDDKNDFEKLKEYLKTEFQAALNEISAKHDDCKDILSADYTTGTKELIQDDNKIELIKNFLDSIKKLQEFIKLFISKDKTLDTDEIFYGLLHYDEIAQVIGVYNKVRNYVTQKPYSVEKFPLTFGCSTLADGWDNNKETSNLCVLLERNENYYLGVMKKTENKIFKEYPKETQNEKNYKKINYKLLPGPNKMLPKVFFSKKNIDFYNPNTELLRKYNLGLFKKGKDFDLSFCHELIDFYKISIMKHPDWKNFDFKFKETSQYQDISEFYRDVEFQGYKITFDNVSENYINSMIEQGKLFLFQIYNKDFSEKSHGTPNLHTLYFKALFDDRNLKDVIYQLNGGAEIFYREKSLEPKVTHKANVPIQNKTNNEKRTLVYDLIKDKRYTFDKFFIHIPITLNFKAKNITKLNDYINNEITQNINNVHIIGIDRGERNLIYISVIDQTGKIIKQFSLNEIGGVNYHDKLDKREKENKETRRSWKSTGTIKELKEGYLSSVVHLISSLVKEYHAIIVLEDLNGGFINSRKKIEKQVYSKFETMLVNKLSYVVDKNDKDSVYNALQLANPDIKGRQNGILFYVPAYNTSKIDPVTGFVNLFYIKKMNLAESKNFIEKFEDIRFNKTDNYFEFDIDYKKFSDKSCGDKTNWTICTYGQRILTYRNPEADNRYDNKEINLTDEFLNLFKKYSIDLNNLKKEITEKGNREFYDEFFKLFKLTVQMRNSIINSETDYLISPVKDKTSRFFNSRNGDETLPKDADANGAYNIARKGLMILNRIKEKPQKIDYKIENEEYYNYIQQNSNYN